MIWVKKEREGGRRKGGEQVDKEGEKTRKQGKELEIKKVLSDKATWYNEKCCTDANRRLAVRYTLDLIVFLRSVLINRLILEFIRHFTIIIINKRNTRYE